MVDHERAEEETYLNAASMHDLISL